MPDTIERLIDSARDRYIDAHGSTSHLHASAADEAKSLQIAIGWVDIALAAVSHHLDHHALANVADAFSCLADAKTYLVEQRAVMASLGGIR